MKFSFIKSYLAFTLNTRNGNQIYLYITHFLEDSMELFGQGYCKKGFLRGHDGKGTDTQNACNLVCLAESDCMFAAFKKGKTCSRYKNKDCELNGANSHITYKRIVIGIFPQLN